MEDLIPITTDFNKFISLPVDEIKSLLQNADKEKEYEDNILPFVVFILSDFKKNLLPEVKEKFISLAPAYNEKYKILEAWYYPLLSTVSEKLFINALTWWLNRSVIDGRQTKEDRKIFLKKELQNVDEILGKTESSFIIECYFRIFLIYALNIFSPSENEENIKNEISKLKAYLLNKKKGVDGVQKVSPNLKTLGNPFKEALLSLSTEKIKKRTNREIRTDLAKIIFGLLKDNFIDSLYDYKKEMLSIDFNRIKAIRARQIDNTYVYTPETDAVLVSFINALSEYRRLLVIENRKGAADKNKSQKIKFVNYNVLELVDYLITKECFLEEDREGLLKFFNGEEITRKIVFQLNINVLGTIFYRLHEKNKIKNDKSITERWLIENFLDKDSNEISKTSLHNMLYRKDNIKSDRVKKGSPNYHIIIELPLK